MTGQTLVLKLTSIIRLLMDYPGGLSMLLGTAEPPSCVAINEIFESVRPCPEQTLGTDGFPMRVSGGGVGEFDGDRIINNEERFAAVIAQCGGWKHVNAITQEYKERYPVAWSVVIEYVCWPKSRVDKADYETISERCGVSRPTVSRIISNFAQELATVIINSWAYRR